MATKLGPKLYRTQVLEKTGGKRTYRSFYGQTARAADRAAEEYKDHREGRKADGPPFGEALKAFIDMRAPVLSPATIRTYRSIQRMLEDYDELWNTSISRITADMLQSVFNDMRQQGRSSKTIRNYSGLIRTVFVESGADYPKVTLPEKVRAEFNVPGQAQLAEVFALFKGTDLELPVLLGSMGMRRAEICALTAEDLTGNILHIHSAIVYNEHQKKVTKAPKNLTSDRLLQIPQQVADLFPDKGPVTDLSPQQLTQRFRRALIKAKIPPFRFHDLRHAFVSIAHAAGIPDAYIQSAGGWSTDYTMRSVYRQTLPEAQKQYADRMTGIIDGLME